MESKSLLDELRASFLSHRADAEKLAKRNEILKQVQHIEARFDEQLPCKKQYNAAPKDVNEFMQNHKCACELSTVGGILQCQYGCSCDHFRKTCGLDCACEGTCIPNTFLHLPEVDVRLGIAGDELYADEDIDSGQLAYVFTGKMTSLEQQQTSVKDRQPDLYSITGRWQGEEAHGIGKPGEPTFVIDTYKEIAGFVNHSCNPNTEVYEIWQNGKLYIVGKAIKYCFKGDILTYDYNWIYTNDAKYAEICLCGSKICQAFIAKVSIDVMQRSIPRYIGILNEMETHNILESQRLDKLEIALRTNKRLTFKEKEEVEHLKQDNEELRLTNRKAVYLKKGILMAKAKLIELQNEVKYKHLVKAEFSHIQTLPDFDDEMESILESVASRASTPNSFASLSTKNDCKGETSTSNEHPKELKSGILASIDNSTNSKGKTLVSIEGLKDPIYNSSWTNVGNFSNESKVDTLTFSKNPRERCVLECRVARALQNDDLPLSIRIPLPIKDNEQCVLMAVKDIDKLLEETRLSSEKSRGICSFLQLPKCKSVSCLSPPLHSPTNSPRSRTSDQSSNSTPKSNQYNLAMNRNQASNIDKKSNSDDEDTKDWKGRECYKLTAIHQIKTLKEINEFDSIENLSIIQKAIKAKGKIGAFNISNIEDTPQKAEDWGGGLLTQDEIKRVYSWIDGTLHARGSNQSQPWSKAREWAFWLHKNCRHPTLVELEKHTKSWVGISTKTLRASNSGKAVVSNTLPLARDVNTILSNVLTFIPFRFCGFTLVESTKSGNIWRIVWSKGNEPLPGNPTFRCAG